MVPGLAILMTWHTTQVQENIDTVITSYSINVLNENLCFFYFLFFLLSVSNEPDV